MAVKSSMKSMMFFLLRRTNPSLVSQSNTKRPESSDVILKIHHPQELAVRHLLGVHHCDQFAFLRLLKRWARNVFLTTHFFAHWLLSPDRTSLGLRKGHFLGVP
jgi:hypothetical protein